MKISIIKTTTNKKEISKTIANELVEKQLSPCVQIISNVKSTYIYENKIHTDSELLIMIKTINKYEIDCKNIIMKYHNYIVPEIIITKADILNDEYKEWFSQNLKNI